MPFDTTYFFYSSNENIQFSTVRAGGVDTTIYLDRGVYPPGFDTTDYAFMSMITSYNAPIKEEDHYVPTGNLIIVFLIAFLIIAWLVGKEASQEEAEEETELGPRKTYLLYYGNKLRFTDNDLRKILIKHFPYFNGLDPFEKDRFISRLRKFMSRKFFKLYGSKGYREMPILVSATAVQLCFGLRKYLLPNFTTINIYPKEFLRVRPSICLLQGNVSGHSINLSWKHFLEGIEDACDGKNVGLHEMAHALYYQTFITEAQEDTRFRKKFDSFNNYGNKAYKQEQAPGYDLYSEYAMKNFQEFWAESIELFFERPDDLNISHPELFTALVDILNQDPSVMITARSPM